MKRPASAAALAAALAVAFGAAWLIAYGTRAAFHSDELTVLFHALRFWTGEVTNPGRPGLLFLLVAPVMALDDPSSVLAWSRLYPILASIGTLALLAWIGVRGAREPEQRWEGALAVLLLLTAGTWTTHSIELRTDSFTTPLTLAAIAVLWRSRWSKGTVALAAVLVAAAVLMSQKSAYNTLGLGLAWLLMAPAQPEGRSARARDAGVAVGVGVGVLAAWFALLSLLSSEGGGVIGSTLSTATSTAFGGGVSQSDKLTWMRQAVERGPLLWGLAVPGVVLALRDRGALGASALVGLVMFAVLPIHRGFFPYYICSLEPLLALSAARTVGALVRLPSRRPLRFALGAVLLLTACWVNRPALEAAEHAWVVDSRLQRELAARAHRLFPSPVPYLAGINVVPGYPELAGYLTAEHREGARRIDPFFLATRLEEGPAHFFVRVYMSRDKYLKNPERKLLYLHWLPVQPNLYVHGARVSWEAGDEEGRGTLEVFIDGDYTVLTRGENTAPLRIDGQDLAPGDRIALRAGTHEVVVGPSATSGQMFVALGEGLPPEVPWFVHDRSMFPKDRNHSRSRYQRYDNKRASYDLLSPEHEGRGRQGVKGMERDQAKEDSRYRRFTLARRPAEPDEGLDEHEEEREDEGEDPSEEPGGEPSEGQDDD